MKKHRLLIVYLAVYVLVNLLFLARFPVVHSDETWLSGLSRNMLQQGSLAVTEPFFDLKPRFPHAIKSVFHLLQMPFLQVFGYNAFAFRLLSLLGGAAALWVFYFVVLRASGQKPLAFAACVLLSLDVQFIQAAHFARAEILVLLGMLLCVYLLLGTGRFAHLWAGVVTGVCIGLHPNSFLVAGLCGGLLVAACIRDKRFHWRRILGYVGVVAAFAAFFVALSFWFDPQFPAHYLAYGDEFAVSSGLLAKLGEVIPYLQRLFFRVTGTYNLPDIRFQLVLFGVVLAAAVALQRWVPQLSALLWGLLGMAAAMTLVGRFSQPYVIFYFPLCYLMLALLLGYSWPRRAAVAVGGLAVAVGLMAAVQIVPVATQPAQYDRYIEEIATVVPQDAKTIGNLNAGYHFTNGALLDVRNLSYLRQSGLSLAQYVETRGVEYLIISDELYALYEKRPYWNGVYGNIHYLQQLDELLENHCTLVHSFVDNQYGVRVAEWQNTARDFTVRIYHYDGG
ncbi:glycosyltransferase family 39 protein [Ruminococcaceae bacterium OttesenSCG-928-O06]|nr:glycosyltransferase family 39 protein [Ruminococcaceae bacterium OttesenSCG-928-O06]